MAISTIRFTGLASGMDTESIVKSMIAPYQNKVDIAQQNKMLMELKKDAWKEINSKIYNFYKETLGTLNFSSNYGKSDVSISNPNVIKVDKDASLPAGNHTIDVTQIAKGATVSSGKIEKDKNGNAVTKGTKLEDLNFEIGDVITVNGKELTVKADVMGPVLEPELEPVLDDEGNPMTDTEGNIITKPKTDAEGNVIMKPKEDAEGNVIMEVKTKGTTIGDIENLLKEDASINAKFDEELGAFIISTKNTGAKQSIELGVKTATGDDKTAERMKALGIVAEKDKDGNDTYKYEGKNARYTYNGGVTLESETNNIDINGLKATLIGESNGVPVSISSVKDTQSTIDFVKDFVSKYNALLEEINGLVDAPRNKDYKPLTSQQKEGMSESDIKLWEKKVNDSILRNDPVLNELAGNMRNIVGSSELFKMGVGTGKDWTEKGKLYIDEEKLKKMLEEDPAKIDEILKDTGTKLYNKISEKLLKGSNVKSSNYMFNDKWLEDQIGGSDKQIAKLESRLAAMESLHYKRFSAMEKMLGQLNQQGSWLSGQFGGN